ncbi:rho guanine nucleotide exchange factor 19 isoform X1 [Oreochromis aureus]|uniref:Uncharacterized protein n=1 Tax=Oreochromis aureus TaxID=47969 RepID=A0A668VLP6_OREAU|nr:rho guanine nucleotide exchange factor 19 isoform X1 [Oreochromis aureus]
MSQSPTTEGREMLCQGFSLESSRAEHTGGLDGGSGSLNKPENCSFPSDISPALRLVALRRTWDLKNNHFAAPKLKIFLPPGLQEDNSNSSAQCDPDKSKGGEENAVGEELQSERFQSKYIHICPLYQDYCLQTMKDDLHRLKDGLLSELITPKYLQSLQTPMTRAESPQRSTRHATPRSQPIRVTPFTLWQDLDEVKASGLLSSLTAREIRLQETMFELIGSEASYLRSLGVAVNHFYKSQELKQTLSQTEHHILFSKIQHVMVASEKFLTDLESRLGENVLISQVGDVVLQHCKHFQNLYVPYVTNMMYQEALINEKQQHNRIFLYTLKKLESDPVCQRKTLKSFLVLPFQRITRIKLLLESILKLTEPDSDSVSNLKKAIDAIHEIVTECDKGVRKMKQIEELVCLEMLLDFGKVKSVPLVTSKRFLVHHGALKQLNKESTYNLRMSFVGVYLHLFNDLLIVSMKKDERFKVKDHAQFPEHVSVQPVKAEVLGLPSYSFLLHLSKTQTGHPTAMIIATDTRSEKEAWMKALSSRH